MLTIDLALQDAATSAAVRARLLETECPLDRLRVACDGAELVIAGGDGAFAPAGQGVPARHDVESHRVEARRRLRPAA